MITAQITNNSSALLNVRITNESYLDPSLEDSSEYEEAENEEMIG